MIADEVQTGMGRTGKWLAVQHTKAKPDIVTLAKGIASGFPMGALVAREDLEFKKSEHGSTFAGGPLACAAALATIGVIEKILPDVSRKGERFRKGLEKYHPRVRGLMIGITLGDKCPEIQKKCAGEWRAGQLCSRRKPPACPASCHYRRGDRPRGQGDSWSTWYDRAIKKRAATSLQRRRRISPASTVSAGSPGSQATRTPSPFHRLHGRRQRRHYCTVNRYPDERVNVLMNALRKYYGDYNFVSGVGMDGVIETIFRTLVDPGETVAISTPTFSFYSLAAMGQGAEIVTVPREADFSVDIKKLIRAGGKAKIVVVCSPEQPHGERDAGRSGCRTAGRNRRSSFPRQCLCRVLGL